MPPKKTINKEEEEEEEEGRKARRKGVVFFVVLPLLLLAPCPWVNSGRLVHIHQLLRGGCPVNLQGSVDINGPGTKSSVHT